jgi:hypothetical protein
MSIVTGSAKEFLLSFPPLFSSLRVLFLEFELGDVADSVSSFISGVIVAIAASDDFILLKNLLILLLRNYYYYHSNRI